MNYLFSVILKFIDFFYQKKIINFFKNIPNSQYDVIIDVGAHKGETILNFLKNFKIKNIYSFEASSKTYKYLDANVNKIRKKYNETNIEIFNTGVGNSNKQKIFNELQDSNSSTFNLIDQDSTYFKRKNRILSFFLKKIFILQKILFPRLCYQSSLSKKTLKKLIY